MKAAEYHKKLIGGNKRLTLMVHKSKLDADSDPLHTAVTADGIAMAKKAGYTEIKGKAKPPVEADKKLLSGDLVPPTE